tara:strand:- start:4118 stop:4654 length:537 start_codon:yes stop_codon:yes gene_type:complete
MRTSSKKVGEIYGDFTLIARTSKKTKNSTTYWIIKCNKCNLEKERPISAVNVKNRCECTLKLTEGQSSLNKLYRDYKNRANRRKQEFDLSIEWFKKITSSDCFYCGKEPNMICKTTRGHGLYVYNSIDRVDNNRGYILGNAVACCDMCNRAKLNYTLDEFKHWIKRLVNYNTDLLVKT